MIMITPKTIRDYAKNCTEKELRESIRFASALRAMYFERDGYVHAHILACLNAIGEVGEECELALRYGLHKPDAASDEAAS